MRSQVASIVALLTSVTIVASTASILRAAPLPGELDPSFGIGGIVQLDMGHDSEVRSVAIQPVTGTIFVGGRASTYIGPDVRQGFGIARLTPAGVVERMTIWNLPGQDCSAWSIALDSRQGCVAAGRLDEGPNKQTRFGVVRFQNMLDLDPFFLRVDELPLRTSMATSLAIQPMQSGGGILIAGYSRDVNLNMPAACAVMRRTAFGARDDNFGGNTAWPGVALTPVPSRNGAVVNAVALQGDRIIVVGKAYVDPDPAVDTYDLLVVAYDNTGAVDKTFGPLADQGIHAVHIDNSPRTEATAITVQPDKSILIAGSSIKGGRKMLSFGRIDKDATSLAGLQAPVGEGESYATEICYQEEIAVPGGKIIAVGSAILNNKPCFVVGRCTSDFKLDQTFNKNGAIPGVLLLPINGIEDTPVSAQVQGNTLIVGGRTMKDGHYRAVLVKIAL